MLTQQPQRILTPEYQAILIQAIKAARVHAQTNATATDRDQTLSQLTAAVLELEDSDPIWLAAIKD